MSTAEVVVASGLDLLPATGDRSQWSEREVAMMDALGLRGERNVQRNGQWEKQSFEAPRPVVELFLSQCRRTGLDPFARQIYCIERGGKWGVQASIDGFRLVAERSREYRGQTQPEWCGKDGVWKDVWVATEAPAAARIGVYRDAFSEPLIAVATYDGYCPRDKTGNLKPANQWKTNPANQLLKCAEALALRKAFPQDLSGIYTNDEMEQATPRGDAPAPRQKAQGGQTLHQVHQDGVDEHKASTPTVAPVDDGALAVWQEWREAIDACPDRGALQKLVTEAGAAFPQRLIPGDPQGRKVGDYLNHAWSKLPEAAEPMQVNESTGEVLDPVEQVDPETQAQGDVTEWKAAAIPDEPQAAPVGDEIPF